MHTALTKKIAVLTLVQYSLVVVATLLVSMYYRPDPDMPYTTIIDFGVIFDGLRHLNFSSILQALNDLPFLVGVPLFLLSLLGLWLSTKKRLGLAGFVFLSQGVLLLGAFGWLGLTSIVFLVLTQQPIDGEVLGEHWPQIMANGLGALIAFYLSHSCKKMRLSILLSGDEDPSGLQNESTELSNAKNSASENSDDD